MIKLFSCALFLNYSLLNINMKNSIKALAILAALGFAGTASAQNSTSATGYAAGNIISPISINPVEGKGGVNFGNIVNGNGAVTEANGSNTYTVNGMAPGTSNKGTIGDAEFTIAGDASQTFAWTATILTPTPATGVTLSNVVLTSSSLGTIATVGASSGTGSLSGGTVTAALGLTVTLNGAATGSFNFPGAIQLAANYN